MDKREEMNKQITPKIQPAFWTQIFSDSGVPSITGLPLIFTQPGEHALATG